MGTALCVHDSSQNHCKQNLKLVTLCVGTFWGGEGERKMGAYNIFSPKSQFLCAKYSVKNFCLVCKIANQY